MHTNMTDTIENETDQMRVGAYQVAYAKTDFKFFESYELTLINDDGTYMTAEFYGPTKKIVSAERGFTTYDGKAQPQPAEGGPKQVQHSRIIYNDGKDAGKLVLHWADNGDWVSTSYEADGRSRDFAKNSDDMAMDAKAHAEKYPTKSFGEPEDVVNVLRDFQDAMNDMPQDEMNDSVWQEIRQSIAVSMPKTA